MDKNSFRELFYRIAQEAIEEAAVHLATNVPRTFVVELHGAGEPGTTMEPEEALNLIYIDEHIFYPVIDVGVKKIRGERTILFVRVSAYDKVPFERTWNSPPGNGPFKIIVPVKL